MNFVRAFVPENLCTCIPVPKTSVPMYQGLHYQDSAGFDSRRNVKQQHKAGLHLAALSAYRVSGMISLA
jgi:hypothetical protein